MATSISTVGELAMEQTLRAELKVWEKAFVFANGGRKADREDIKQNPAIGINT